MTADSYIAHIKKSKKTCYFVSPHYDDAVFSAGALLNSLKDTNRIVVINVFTQADHRPYTMSAKAYLKQCSYSNAELLYEDRREEDRNALSGIANEVIDLNFTEALWRKRRGFGFRLLANVMPELGNIYPTYRFHITQGRISRSDSKTLTEIKYRLKELINAEDAAVFCPLAIGGHVDHAITRAACDTLFPKAIHWADYPYNLDSRNNASTAGMRSFVFQGDDLAKQNLIKKYVTQYSAMFRDGLSLKPESFFYSDNVQK